MRTIEEIWKKFETTVLDKNAGEVQRAEMRMAFVSGMFALVKEINKPGKINIDEFINAVQDASNEYSGSRSVHVYDANVVDNTIRDTQ